MKYCIVADDLFDHTFNFQEYDNLEEAREAFKAECYTPAQIYDDFLTLEVRNDDGDWVDTIDDYQFTRLDRTE